VTGGRVTGVLGHFCPAFSVNLIPALTIGLMIILAMVIPTGFWFFLLGLFFILVVRTAGMIYTPRRRCLTPAAQEIDTHVARI
jgi:hypothetical protein